MTTTLTAHGPEDLLAAVPVVLGFHPQESLVMLTFGAARSFHARLDLPPVSDTSAIQEVVELLLAPSLSHEVDQVAFVAYTADAGVAAALAAALVPAFVADGVGVIDVLRAHGGGWCSVPIRAGAQEAPLVPYDDRHHPFSAQAVFEGRVTHRSREALRATVAPDAGRRSRWGEAMTVLPDPGPEEIRRACRLVGGWVASGADPDDDEAVRVLRAVSRIDVRDAALYAVTRETARDHLRVWAALLRGAPDPAVPDTAAVTAFCAWLCGDGALAWCALDRCFEVDPDHRLGACLAECLVRAVPPTAWAEVVGDDARHPDTA
jgi:hypothetical protein